MTTNTESSAELQCVVDCEGFPPHRLVCPPDAMEDLHARVMTRLRQHYGPHTDETWAALFEDFPELDRSDWRN